MPCNATELVHFRKRISVKGFNLIFKMSVALHGKQAQESTVMIDTTASEKTITYPTDAKLAIKIINRLNKLAKRHGIGSSERFSSCLSKSKPTISLMGFEGLPLL
jgi:IS5 family transposase